MNANVLNRKVNPPYLGPQQIAEIPLPAYRYTLHGLLLQDRQGGFFTDIVYLSNTDIKSRIINHIYTKMWEIITHLGPNSNGGLAEPPFDMDE